MFFTVEKKNFLLLLQFLISARGNGFLVMLIGLKNLVNFWQYEEIV